MRQTDRWCATLVALGVGALGVLPASAAGAKGWHGEEMPTGLLRGDGQGEYVWHQDGAVMVYVPAGRFPMGSDGAEKDEQPVHEVELDAFYIDVHEVSWERYLKSALPIPPAPSFGILADHPVVNVRWDDARQFAAWAGKRLPTEAEWEKAARGTDRRTYPWGDDPPNFDRAVWRAHPIAETSTAPVNCCAEGASPYGVLNLAGNVYEWCEDVYDAGYYSRSPARNPLSGEGSPYRVLRGGAYVLELEDLRAGYRYRLLAKDRTPYIGFRTVLPASAPGD